MLWWIGGISFLVAGPVVLSRVLDQKILDATTASLSPIVEPLGVNGYVWSASPTGPDCVDVQIVSVHTVKPNEDVHVSAELFTHSPAKPDGGIASFDVNVSGQAFNVTNVKGVCFPEDEKIGIIFSASNGGTKNILSESIIAGS